MASSFDRTTSRIVSTPGEQAAMTTKIAKGIEGRSRMLAYRSFANARIVGLFASELNEWKPRFSDLRSVSFRVG